MNANERALRDATANTRTRQGGEELANAKAVLLRTIRELESYERQYEAATTNRDRANVLSYAVNHLASNVLGNCRLDLMVTTAYEIGTIG